jgi:hypothetical protein
MTNEEMMKNMMDLFANPLFKKDFFDFFLKVQREGIESAKKFWGMSGGANLPFPNALDIYEKMIDFYITLGFVPRSKYDQAMKENEELKKENKFLKDTMNELQFNIFKEGSEQMRETWRSIIDKQFEVNKDIAKNFFELFKQLQGSGK